MESNIARNNQEVANRFEELFFDILTSRCDASEALLKISDYMAEKRPNNIDTYDIKVDSKRWAYDVTGASVANCLKVVALEGRSPALDPVVTALSRLLFIAGDKIESDEVETAFSKFFYEVWHYETGDNEDADSFILGFLDRVINYTEDPVTKFFNSEVLDSLRGQATLTLSMYIEMQKENRPNKLEKISEIRESIGAGAKRIGKKTLGATVIVATTVIGGVLLTRECLKRK